MRTPRPPAAAAQPGRLVPLPVGATRRRACAGLVLALLSWPGPSTPAAPGMDAVVEGLGALGDNGYIVDPLIIEVKLSSPVASCGGEVLLPSDLAKIATYCGDLDGCRVRLVSLGSKRSQSPPVVMTTDATGTVWTRSTADNAAVSEGDVTDGVAEQILVTRSADNKVTCRFIDSATEASYGIANCFDDPGMADDAGDHTCTLVIHE